MTADEMFKELGYEKRNEENADFIIYECETLVFTLAIGFDKSIKSYMGYFKCVEECLPFPFGAKEQKAINKKIEELGWL